MGNHQNDDEDAVQQDTDGGWPAWMVTLGVVAFCAAFWVGAYFIWKLLV